MMALVSESRGRLAVDEFVGRWRLGLGGGGTDVAVGLESVLFAISFVGDGGNDNVGCLFLESCGGDARSGDGADEADTNVSLEETDPKDADRLGGGVGFCCCLICGLDTFGLTTGP